MRLATRFLNALWQRLLVLGGVLAVLWPLSPANMSVPYRDSGVFLYVGWRILNGELPYRDIWDHKPPLVFYTDALGLSFSNPSRWGVWLIELGALWLAATISYLLIKRSMGTVPAVLSLIYWLLTLVFVIEGGNLTEEYALPLQFALLWLVPDLDGPAPPFWRYFLLGLAGAAAFLLKQTTIGLWLASVIWLILRAAASKQGRAAGRGIGAIAAGGLSLCVAVVVFFGLQGSLAQFWSAAFYYNFVYSSTLAGLSNRLAPIYLGIKPLAATGLLQVAMLGYCLAGILVLYRRQAFGKWLPMILIGLIDLPLELVLVSVSGQTFPHYYVTLLPVLSLFAGVAFWFLVGQLQARGVPILGHYLFTVGIVAALLWSSYSDYRAQVLAYKHVGDPTSIADIQSLTRADEYVLFWGADAGANFLSQRRSPSPFVYQYPLYEKGYVDEQMIQAFLTDVIANHPKLIVDTADPDAPFLKFPVHSSAIRPLIAELRSRYRVLQQMGAWTIYEYVGSAP